MKIIIQILLIITLLIIPKNVDAAKEFSATYNVTYDVLESGVTEVTEDVILKNLTDNYFASSFNLVIGAGQISEVTASDKNGPLEVSVNKLGDGSNNRTDIQVKFTSQVVGLDKEYRWTLKFKSNDFTQSIGKVKQVTVPKISSLDAQDNYNLSLKVPVSFNDPSSITPQPLKQSEVGGKLQFNFEKKQLTNTGILANFGTEQLFDFGLKYTLINSGILPAIGDIPLPSNNDFQSVSIDQISPSPENVTLDSDGNYIAYFKVPAKQTLEVKVKGKAKLFLENQSKTKTLTSEQISIYTSAQKFWDSDNQSIKTKLSEIFQNQNPKTNQEKARLINNFVVNSLTYGEDRLDKKDFERLGAVTALKNPTLALCSEFTDLFISLSRAAGVPARQIVGYAYTNNPSLRPLSLEDEILHTWPEYFDPKLGWVMIDPTWQNTTGGVDYFSKFDLNHLTLGIRGVSSEEPIVADSVEVKFSEGEITPRADLKISLNTPAEIFAGFPSKAKILVENKGNSPSLATTLNLSSAKVNLTGGEEFRVPLMPPGGKFEYEFGLRTAKIWESYEDIIQIKLGDQVVSKKVIVKPFFAYKYFSFAVLGFTILMVAIYLTILFLHLYRHKVILRKK